VLDKGKGTQPSQHVDPTGRMLELEAENPEVYLVGNWREPTVTGGRGSCRATQI
jgi:hypothetical protein